VEQSYTLKHGGRAMETVGGLNILFGIDPAGLNAIGETGEWTELEFAVDSGVKTC